MNVESQNCSRPVLQHIFVNCLFAAAAFLLTVAASSAQVMLADSLEQSLRQELSPSVRVHTLLRLSEIYMSRNPDKAFRYISDAQKSAKTAGDERLVGYVSRELGNYYLSAGEKDSARICLSLALQLLPGDPLTHYYSGRNEWFNGDADSCLEYYRKAVKSAIRRLDAKTAAVTYTALADYYRYHNNDTLAQEYISSSIRILSRMNEPGELAMAYNIQAEIYRVRGDYSLALETYLKTASIAYAIVDSNRIGYCLSRMGYIYYMRNEIGKAEAYMIKSLDISRKIRKKNLEAFSLKVLTDLHSNQEDIDQCRYYAKLCIAAGKELNDPTSVALAYSALSNLFYRTGSPDSCLFYADLAYNLAKANDDYLNMLNAILNKIALAADQGATYEVIRLTKEGILLAEETETFEHLKDLYQYQYEAYEKTGDHAAAYRSLKQFEAYEDMLENSDVSADIHKSQLEMGYLEKHLADTLAYIEQVQKGEQEALLQKQRSLYFQVIGGITVFFLLTGLYITWNISRRRKRLNIVLTESNHEKELLLREIHHRVKNSLQVVSSLLSLQKGQAAEKSFDELIDESQLKISNIAIVHDLLYQSSSFKKIDLRSYIHRLSGYILDTFVPAGGNVEIIVDAVPLEIGFSKSVPLALIMNEILTNSAKYAFTGRNSGTIKIGVKCSGDRVLVTVTDNGSGLPEDIAGGSNSGTGLMLIHGFVRQIGGEIKYGNNNGSFFILSFPLH